MILGTHTISTPDEMHELGRALGAVLLSAKRAREAEAVYRADLKAYPTLWAAGGTPNAVFEIGFQKLADMSGAIVADVKT